MKKLLSLLLWCGACMPGLFGQTYANLRFEPARPKPGEKIVITYDPGGTPLAGAAQVEGLVVAIKSGGAPFPLTMKREGNAWTAAFATTDSTSLILFTFRDGKITDNNHGKGYPLYTYTPEGNPLPGARGWLGLYYGLYTTEAVARDAARAIVLFEEEFSAYPASKDQLMRYFLHIFQQARPAEYPARALAEYAAIAAGGNLTVQQLALLAAGYQALEQTDLAAKYLAALRERDPQHEVVQRAVFRQVADEEDPAKKAALFNGAKKDFPTYKRINDECLLVAQAYRQHEKFAELEQFARENDRYLGADAYNVLAWTMYEANQDLKLAEAFAATAVAKARSSGPGAGNAPSPPERAGPLAMVLDTHGAILAKRGKSEAAHAALKEAVSLMRGNDAKVNERYVAVLVQTKRYKEALAAGDRFIPEGKSTRTLKEDLRRAYIAVNGNEKGFDRQLEALEASARERMKKELTGKMISKPAPSFTLQDLNGNTISSEALKGKTVVVDFWATWCGPCVASMPGMQQAMARYKADPTVQFLFVNSWQREADKQQVVRNFLEKKKYDFTVPMDVDNQVIGAYQVDAIPAKFVIDPQGNIRFKSVGFEGDPDALVEELSLMIDLAKDSKQ